MPLLLRCVCLQLAFELGRVGRFVLVWVEDGIQILRARIQILKRNPLPLRMKRRILIPIDRDEPKEDKWTLFEKPPMSRREERVMEYISEHGEPLERAEDDDIIMLSYSSLYIIFHNDGSNPYVLERKRNVYRDMMMKRMQRS